MYQLPLIYIYIKHRNTHAHSHILTRKLTFSPVFRLHGLFLLKSTLTSLFRVGQGDFLMSCNDNVYGSLKTYLKAARHTHKYI